MEAGAVIVAAGMSSRMGDFKPMLNVGSISIAQRIIATMQQAGVRNIVVITGYNADALERHLSRCGVIFLRNENYRTTEMFDSACIGLRYLKSKCERVLFTPVDIPLFTAGTVSALLASGAELACPVCEGKEGHPIMLSPAVIESVLADNGAGGLQGALKRSGFEKTLIEVPDAGILHDADTPEDYNALLEYHNSQLIRPLVQVSLAREKPFFNEQIAMLLTLVDETHSVRGACQRMQLSYSSGWNTIKLIEQQVGCKLVARNHGGAGGGSSSLTDEGRRLLASFRAFEAELKDEAERIYARFFPELL